ncbi:lactam utilization protein LamB [Lewinellaceae bacterium SD302]|nr:lactam utilization protein LamB [Lewinellaceae bacterium SD302]
MVDLNCDMGESWYEETVGRDTAIMPLITSCNLACGVHGGDPGTMQRSVELALLHKINIGAHPSLPGQQNFGREPIDMPEQELNELIYSQVDRLQAEVKGQGGELTHLKAHGALYHLAASQPKEAMVVVAAAIYFGIPKIFGPPESALGRLAERAGLTFVAEGFVDRVYENGRQLRSRSLAGGVIQNPAKALAQARQMAEHGWVIDYYGTSHPIQVETLCLHGDNPAALEIAEAIHGALEVRRSPNG